MAAPPDKQPTQNVQLNRQRKSGGSGPGTGGEQHLTQSRREGPRRKGRAALMNH